MSTSIVFETHSITEDDEAEIATGWLPGRLSPRGRELAQELGARRRDDGLSAVFTSDLARATETVSEALGDAGIPVLLDWRLRECDYGELNGSGSPGCCAIYGLVGRVSGCSSWGTWPPGGPSITTFAAYPWRPSRRRTSRGDQGESTRSDDVGRAGPPPDAESRRSTPRAR